MTFHSLNMCTAVKDNPMEESVLNNPESLILDIVRKENCMHDNYCIHC